MDLRSNPFIKQVLKRQIGRYITHLSIQVRTLHSGFMFDWNRLTRLRKYKRFYSLLRSIYNALVIELMPYSKHRYIVEFAISYVRENRGFRTRKQIKANMLEVQTKFCLILISYFFSDTFKSLVTGLVQKLYRKV